MKLKRNMSETDREAATELTAAMEVTMRRLQGRFRGMSQQLESKLDEMGTRIHGLEKNVSELTTQAGVEEHAVSE